MDSRTASLGINQTVMSCLGTGSRTRESEIDLLPTDFGLSFTAATTATTRLKARTGWNKPSWTLENGIPFRRLIDTSNKTMAHTELLLSGDQIDHITVGPYGIRITRKNGGDIDIKPRNSRDPFLIEYNKKDLALEATSE